MMTASYTTGRLDWMSAPTATAGVYRETKENPPDKKLSKAEIAELMPPRSKTGYSRDALDTLVYQMDKQAVLPDAPEGPMGAGKKLRKKEKDYMREESPPKYYPEREGYLEEDEDEEEMHRQQGAGRKYKTAVLRHETKYKKTPTNVPIMRDNYSHMLDRLASKYSAAELSSDMPRQVDIQPRKRSKARP